MHPHGVERPDVPAGERRALVVREVVALREILGRLEKGVAAGGLAVDVPNQLLQSVKAHAPIRRFHWTAAI
jgi:hypothetical protein